ncbi:MAG TPA: asparagine synthase (glutamine-hydrolyzing), partial [Paludibacteraceae bacterium]|nr:asparagine synthase (glutamine-hydrolyzing) [Paludibacteraceae bacterium]
RFTQISEEDKCRLDSMNQEMRYRGPDENGVWLDDACGLAQTRLSIIGLNNGHQPLFNEDGSLVLVCNGEIYNFEDLRILLRSKGHVISTDSDCEVIIHLYEEFGVKCLDYLRGMFAFVLWNTRKKQLFAARDRVGEKCLYYAQIQTGVVFSSELKAILKYYIEKPQLNAHAFAESIRYNYPIELQQTYIEQIKRLRAGEYALVDAGGLELHSYWNRYCLPKYNGSLVDAKTEILRLMRESVSQCLRSDVPVAVLLSGGIDSSAVATFAKETGREVHVISAGYKGNFGCDERSVAKQFAKGLGLVYHEVELNATDFQHLFDEYTDYIDEPVCDVSSMSQWALYKKAKELGFTVLLGGLGGDELFYGYPYSTKVAESISLFHQHRDLFPWKHKKLDFLKFMFHNWKHVLYAGYPYKVDDKSIVAWTYDDYLKFAQHGTLSFANDKIDFSKIDVHYNLSSNATVRDVYDYMFSRFMTNLCLYLADRQGMGNSVEIRSPFVDYKLVEFVSSLPDAMKYKQDQPKWLIKETLKGIVPDYILYAQKRGFTPPFEFIYQMNDAYKYQMIESDHVFFNSMLADRLLVNLLKWK